MGEIGVEIVWETLQVQTRYAPGRAILWPWLSRKQKEKEEVNGKTELSNRFMTEENNIEATLQSTPAPLITTMRGFFDSLDWAFTEIGQNTLQLDFRGSHGKWACLARTQEELKQAAFYSYYPVQVPPNKRAALAEFIARANFDMIIGNFELDFNDGEIRFKTSLDVRGDRLTPALVSQMVYANVTAMDQYWSGLEAILVQNLSPAEAIALVEG
jgi:hypothetical protein